MGLWRRFTRWLNKEEIKALDAYVELWKKTAEQEQKNCEYYVELATYYKEQWEETLKYVPPEVRKEIMITKEMTH